MSHLLIDEIECEVTLVTLTGSTLKYKYKKDNGHSIMRTLIPGPSATVATTVENVRLDGESLIKVSEHLAYMDATFRIREGG